VAQGNLIVWLKAAKPDIIMMHLGTNDVIQKKPVGDIINAYSTLVDQMRQSKPTMQILISQLIPIDRYNANPGIVELNKAIVAWAPTKTTRYSPITLIDNYTGFNTTTDTVDGEHPNAAGDEKFANKFFQPLTLAIKSVSPR
jgi:lysophospholipase L1-like esterase